MHTLVPALHLPALLSLLQSHAHAGHGGGSGTPGTKHAGHMPPWLLQLGLPGLFLISLLDAAIIPLPLPGSTDVLLLLLAAQRSAHLWLLALTAIVASVLGGYTTWKAGQKGGEAMLEFFASKRMIRPVKKWMRSHGLATIAISGLLPPPVPLMPLLLGAGALGASRRHFILAFAAARTVRYGLVCWIAATYGRRVLRVWNQYLSEWSAPILWTFFSLLLAAVAFGFWQYRRKKQSWERHQKAPQTAAPASAQA